MHRRSYRKQVFAAVVSAALAGWCASAAADAQTPPASSKELFDWLKAGNYKNWERESEPHPSAGGHPGAVNVYLDPSLAGALKAQARAQPEGSAAVLELFGKQGKVHGWAVSIKTQPDSAGGKGWFWYQVFSATDGNRTLAADRGVAVCTECHAKGRDFVMSAVPLR